jgi:hypothetical protein
MFPATLYARHPKMIKKRRKINVPVVIFAITLFVVNILALDDITTGNEPDFWGEWDFLLFSLIVFSLVVYSNWKSVKLWITKKLSSN